MAVMCKLYRKIWNREDKKNFTGFYKFTEIRTLIMRLAKASTAGNTFYDFIMIFEWRNSVRKTGIVGSFMFECAMFESLLKNSWLAKLSMIIGKVSRKNLQKKI